jgi:hypothetical protein
MLPFPLLRPRIKSGGGNPYYGPAGGLPRRAGYYERLQGSRTAPRNDEFLRAFAPLREPNLFLFSRQGAKAPRKRSIYGPGSNIVECAADVLRLLGHNMPPVGE